MTTTTTDNWIKLYRWWQEHLKTHFVPSTMITDHHLLQRRSSLMSFRSRNHSHLIKMKKRASYSEIDEHQVGYNDFRHVRDSIRGKNSRTIIMTSTTTNNRRRQLRKATTCDVPADEIIPNENKKLKSMKKFRENSSRRFSLVKFELPNLNSHETKDEQKSTIPSASPNLLQKLFFRQFSPKTRPCSMGVSTDENSSSSIAVVTETPTTRRKSSTAATKQSWTNPLSSKQNIRNAKENLLLSPSNKILSISHQSDLNSYLSKRRNTTGSISLNKIVDIKTSSKLTAAVATFSNSNNKISTENIFQTIEDSDFLATKQLIQMNENIINSYNEYDWCPLDIAIMLNNTSMIRLLFHYGAEESSKIQPEEVRYQNVCQQLSNLTEQNSEELIKKSSSSKLTPDDAQLRRSSPSNDKQQRHRRTSKSQQQQLNQQRSLTLSQMKDNYEQAGKNHKL